MSTLPTLYNLRGAVRQHVTEMGTRTGSRRGPSRSAQPKTLVCNGIQHYPDRRGDIASSAARLRLEFIQADTLKVDIEETDLLFVDTLHAGRAAPRGACTTRQRSAQVPRLPRHRVVR